MEIDNDVNETNDDPATHFPSDANDLSSWSIYVCLGFAWRVLGALGEPGAASMGACVSVIVSGCGSRSGYSSYSVGLSGTFRFPSLRDVQAQAQLKESAREFLDFFDAMHVTNCSVDVALRPVRAHVTTMTIIGKLSGDITFLKSMASRHNMGYNQAKCCRLLELVEESGFFNPAPSGFSDKALQLKAKTLPASIKIFPIGSIQMTGIKSQPELAWVLDEVCRLISSVDASCGVVCESFEPVMINVGIATSTGFNLENILHIVRGIEDGYAEMPERPPLCNVRLPCGNGTHSTLMVYKSGKIIMSGKTPGRIAIAYRMFMNAMHANLNQVIAPRTVDAVRRAITRFHWTELMPSALNGITHTHGPCKSVVEGCAYCRLFGNVFAPAT